MTRRGYLSESELEEFADITVTDTDEGEDQVSQAEELIDIYVGPQQKFFPGMLEGLASGGATTQLILDLQHKTSYPYRDYFKHLIAEILGGTNEGERKKITTSTELGVLTTEAFSSAVDTTSFYRIYQVGKFPRYKDVSYYSLSAVPQYYKMIPEAVKRATASQVQFMIEMGPDYFATDKALKTSESIGDYSYSKAMGGIEHLIAPKAKQFLRGITNRTGVMTL